MCFGQRNRTETQPTTPVHTPAFQAPDANNWFHVSKTDQAGNEEVLQEGIGKPPKSMRRSGDERVRM